MPQRLTAPRALLRLESLCALILSVGLASCAGVGQQVSAAQNDSTPKTLSAFQAQFDETFQANWEATGRHFSEEVECVRRDQHSGFPTSRIPMPAATRHYIDASRYTAHYFFPRTISALDDLHSFISNHIFMILPDGYTKTGDGSYTEYSRIDRPGGAPKVRLTKVDKELMIVFIPSADLPLPWGEPCAKGSPPASSTQR